MIDAGLDQLHEVVAAKLGGHPALADLVEEAEAAGKGSEVEGSEVSALTRQRMELELTAAARKDDTFGQAVIELAARLRAAEQAMGTPIAAGPGTALFTGDARVKAEGGGIAIGQVGRDVNVNQGATDPSQPGRDRG